MLHQLIIKEISKFYNVEFLTVEAEYHFLNKSIDKTIEHFKKLDNLEHRVIRCALAINEGYNVKTDKEVVSAFIDKKFFTVIQGENINELRKKSKSLHNCVMIFGNEIHMRGNGKVIEV